MLSSFKADISNVFYEELDLLGFNKYWKYPKSENPLLWANGRRYFYKGELVAIAKGGDAFNLPKIQFEECGEDLKLDEIIVVCEFIFIN